MKKIILLSDGTGNGAAKRHKTNVWRLYNALYLHRSDQIAKYDDGVGSQEFVLFKLLGGAFGWGLKRNVLELYKFLCRNYDAGNDEEEPDKIYLFGFSRGAFTVRVLIGLIDECGLCRDFESENHLHSIAHANFAIYRKKFKGFQLSKLFPNIRNRSLIRNRSRLECAVRPNIEFIGVWDTVDAYGLPFDWLMCSVDRLIFPMRFQDRHLSKKVRKACHAVSVDDERQSFEPVLWDVTEEADSERIEQVWFPGVHSDIGGGYPRESLALVSLDWMISKVETKRDDASGLVFLNDLREDYRRRCDWNGVQHDSRSGLSAFYRYKPRNIGKLCRKAGAADCEDILPKLHDSVLERIGSNVVPYSPTGLPKRYEIVTTQGTATEIEPDEEKDKRFAAMNFALDVIYWRRWLYYVFLVTTTSLIASLLFFEPQATVACCVSMSCCVPIVCCMDADKSESACEFLKDILPDFATPWVTLMCENPKLLIVLATLYVILGVLKGIASRKTLQHAASAWLFLKRGIPPPKWSVTVTFRLRAFRE